MSSHRPKSLSELNNVYDKALRAEKAIKESSSLLSTPETSETKPTENIFTQLETKAAEAKKTQVFDPDITNIALDFLKRYAQPEKPKAAPKEIKRPAPTIQSVQPHVRKPKTQIKADNTLTQGTVTPPEIKAPGTPVRKPSHDVPATDAFVTAPQTIVSAESSVPAYAEPVAEEPATQTPTAPAPVVKAPAVKKTPTKTAPAQKIDHTPRPAPSRVRITSTERSELMEEYMRVMSDDDDEPSEKKSVFSFFRKKKHDDYDDEPVESIYEDLDEEDSADAEVPVVAFDSSNVKYEDEYSHVPVSEDEAVASAPMNLYDYIEADFDSDEDEDATLDISTTTFEKEEVETDEFYGEVKPETEAVVDEAPESDLYPAEEVSEELSDMQDTFEETAEEIIEPEVIDEPEMIAEAEAVEEAEEVAEIIEADETAEVQEEIQEIEEIVPTEEYYDETSDTAEETDSYAPPADMEFEDIFSVSDESKRSHTGGDWGGTVPAEPMPSYESEEAYGEEDNVYDDYDEYDEEEYADEYPEKKRGNVFVKILLVFFAIISLALGGATAVADILLDIDSGKLISDSYRLFCAKEDMPSFDIGKGDLIVAKNVFVNKDSVYVYAISEDTYGVGRGLENTDSPLGELLFATETVDGNQLIRRDSSMGVVVASYGTLGSILSIVCSYGIFITIAFVLIAIGLIVLLVIISKKKSASDYYIEDDSSRDGYDEDDNSDDSDDSEEYDDDEDYYSEYDTDGIEQGLFSNI